MNYLKTIFMVFAIAIVTMANSQKNLPVEVKLNNRQAKIAMLLQAANSISYNGDQLSVTFDISDFTIVKRHRQELYFDFSLDGNPFKYGFESNQLLTNLKRVTVKGEAFWLLRWGTRCYEVTKGSRKVVLMTYAVSFYIPAEEVQKALLNQVSEVKIFTSLEFKPENLHDSPVLKPATLHLNF